MNRIVIIFLLIISSTRIYSLPLVQVNNTRPINEKVTLFTDRNLYAEGEIIQFAAHIGNNEDSASLVLYVELISDTGNQIVGKKFKVERQFAKGSIKIPDQIPSGSYFIKAYTRWMRNFDPSEYSYTQVLIFNAKEDFIVSNRHRPARAPGARRSPDIRRPQPASARAQRAARSGKTAQRPSRIRPGRARLGARACQHVGHRAVPARGPGPLRAHA